MTHIELLAAALRNLQSLRPEIRRQDLLKLLAKKLNVSEQDLRFGPLREIDAATLALWEADMALLARDYPWQYILGETYFMGETVKVEPGVLIPRPDSEVLVEECLNCIEECLNCIHEVQDTTQAISTTTAYNSVSSQAVLSAVGASGRISGEARKRAEILEIGVGSGALIVGILSNFIKHSKYYGRYALKIDATDINPEALDLAARNIAEFAGNDHNSAVNLYYADLFPDANSEVYRGQACTVGQKYRIIYSNPPYISTNERTALARSVSEYEPETALFAGHDGMEFYERILNGAADFLEIGGYLLFEHGAEQQEQLIALAAANPRAVYRLLKKRRDYRGLNRVTVFALEAVLI